MSKVLELFLQATGGSYYMSRDELAVLFKDMDIHSDFDQLFDAFDTNGDGQIHVVEFLDVILGAPRRPLQTSSEPTLYSKVQYVALEICTMPKGFDTQWTTSDDYYIGRSHIPTDIQSRVDLIGEALEQAFKDPAIDKSPSTLKLFMAPEFLFRGPAGAYSLSQVLGKPDSAGSLEAQLASLVLGDKWKNWLCVFGTVIGYTRKGDSKEVYNVSLIQDGGHLSLKRAALHASAVIKQYKSGIDFLSQPNYGGLADGDVRHVLQPIDVLEVKNDPDSLEVDDDGIFAIDGITFGLEICLDHAMKKLSNTQLKSGDNRMQIQLVPSGGMTVQPEAICVQPGGLVFHCDGLTNGRRRYGAHSSAFTMGSSGLVEAKPLTSFGAFGSSWEQKLRNLYWDEHEPMISIYPSLDLPAPTPV